MEHLGVWPHRDVVESGGPLLLSLVQPALLRGAGIPQHMHTVGAAHRAWKAQAAVHLHDVLELTPLRHVDVVLALRLAQPWQPSDEEVAQHRVGDARHACRRVDALVLGQHEYGAGDLLHERLRRRASLPIAANVVGEHGLRLRDLQQPIEDFFGDAKMVAELLRLEGAVVEPVVGPGVEQELPPVVQAVVPPLLELVEGVGSMSPSRLTCFPVLSAVLLHVAHVELVLKPLDDET